MAKFGQQFIQSLITPAYGQGLFEASKAVGSMPERARFTKQLEDLTSTTSTVPAVNRVNQLTQLAQEARLKGNTQRAIALENAVTTLTNQVKAEGAAQIAVKLQELDRAVDSENIKRLQDEINTLAINTMQSDPGKYVGLGSKRREKVDELLELQSERQIEALSSTIAASSIEDINAFVDEDPRLAGLSDREKGKLIKGINDIRKIRNANDEALRQGTLQPEHEAFLKQYPDLLDNPSVAAAVRTIDDANNPNKSVTPGAKTDAIKTISAAVTAKSKEIREINNSSDRLDAKAERMVEALLEEDSISEWVYGEDLIEVVDRVSNDEDMQDDFYKFIGQEIQINRDVDPQVAVKTALDLLGEKYDLRLEEGRQLNKEEASQEAADREAAITALMEREDLSKKDAIRRLNELEAERRKGEGNITDVRSRAREEQFGPSPYANLPEATRGQDSVTPSEALQGIGTVGKGILTSFPGGPPPIN